MTSLFPPFNRRSSFRKQPYFFEAGRGVNYKSTGGPFPTLDLNFLSGTLDPRITFSRASNATLTDSTGKITYAPNNLLTYSQDFSNAAWQKYQGSITSTTAGTAPDGTNTANLFVPASGTGQHIFSTASGGLDFTSRNYTFSIYVKSINSTYQNLTLWLSNDALAIYFNLANQTVSSIGAKTQTGSVSSVGNGWYRCSWTSIVPAGSASQVIWVTPTNTTQTTYPYNSTGDGTSGMLFWGAQLEAVTYQTTPSTYNATTTAAYYGPRFDYDPVTLAAKGLLIEEARTNLALRSQAFDNAAWGEFSGVLPVATNIAAPDGTLTANRFDYSATPAARFRYQLITFSSAGAYTLSLWVKAQASAVVGLRFSGYTGATNTQAAISVGTTWQRISITANIAAGDLTGEIGFDQRSGVIPGVTDNAVIDVWGAQLEAGAFATSYIPTVASSVARSADIATMTGTNFSSWFNQGPVNLLTYSEQFDNAAWIKSSASILTDTTTAPNGTTTADTATPSASVTGYVGQQYAGSIGAVYTFSFYIKNISSTQSRLIVRNASTAVDGYINWSGATITSITQNVGTTTFTNVGSGWYRVQGSYTAIEATQLCRILPDMAAGTQPVYIWGAQLEVGSTATTYIPTTTAPVASPPAVGTLIEDAYWNSAFTTAYIYYTTFTMDNTVNNIISLTTNSLASAYRVRFGAVDQVDITISPAVLLTNIRAKRAMAFETNNFATAVNGGNVSVDTVGSVPAVILLNFNLFNGGSRTIASIKYYPTRLTNAKLQALTV